MVRLKLVSLALCLLSSQVFADACDYRPSRLLGDSGSKVVVGGGLTVGSGGALATGAGLYTLVNAGSGLTMLGSTMAGASGAGTIGIIAGTGGTLGAAVAVILNPFVWIPAAIAGVGGGGFEATCAFLVDERIVEFEDVLEIMRSFSLHADLEYFKLVETAIPPFIFLRYDENQWVKYYIEDLYIVDGVLKNRDFGFNTSLGRVILLGDDSPSDSGQN